VFLWLHNMYMIIGQQIGPMKHYLLPIYSALFIRADFYTATSHSVVSFKIFFAFTMSIWQYVLPAYMLWYLSWLKLCVDIISYDTHTRLTALFAGLPMLAGTRKVNQSGFYWSKRQWVAVASAEPYASLHLTADR